MIEVSTSPNPGKYTADPAEIEEILGIKRGSFKRELYDVALANSCRWLKSCGVDLKNEEAIRKAFPLTPWYSPRYVDALVVVAKTFSTY